MKTQIFATTALYGLGHPAGKKLLRLESGPSASRLVAVMQTAANDIKYTYADRPYTSWADPTLIAVDADDNPCDCVMDDDGNIHVVYTEQSTQNLVTKKLSFDGSGWSLGSQVTIYNGAPSLYPSVAIEPSGKLWVSWTRVSGGLAYVHIKSSDDGGATWGSGPADAGDALTSGDSSAYSKTVIGPDDIHVVYTHGAVQCSIRSQPITGGSWTAEFDIATGTLLDQHFDVAISSDGGLGVVYDHGSLKYREYNGETWNAAVTLDTDGGDYPQLVFNDSVPAVIYLSTLATDQKLMKYTVRVTGSFSDPVPLDPGARQFDAVFLYDASAATYADVTAGAADSTTGDVIHPDSGTLFKDSNDVLYIGMDHRFRYLNILLSTAGSGGAVVYSYWDGAAWRAFTPSGGAFTFDALDTDLPLWPDMSSVPGDWQRTSVYGQSRFWVRVETVTPFTTGPIGSQLTAVADLTAMIVRR